MHENIIFGQRKRETPNTNNVFLFFMRRVSETRIRRVGGGWDGGGGRHWEADPVPGHQLGAGQAVWTSPNEGARSAAVAVKEEEDSFWTEFEGLHNAFVEKIMMMMNGASGIIFAAVEAAAVADFAVRAAFL
jgi:hypothetical protein